MRIPSWTWGGGTVVLSWLLTAILITSITSIPFDIVMDWLEQHEKLAGWFQGVIAVVAIVGVFLVAQYQTLAESRRSKDDQRRSARDKYLATASSLGHVEACYFVAQEEVQQFETIWDSIDEEFRHAREAIRTLLTQPFELPHPDLVWKLSLVDQNLRLSISIFKAMRSDSMNELRMLEPVLRILEERRDKINGLIKWCIEQAKALSTDEELEQVARTWVEAEKAASG